jgi:DNA-binding NarL/FixJ family response regulator
MSAERQAAAASIVRVACIGSERAAERWAEVRAALAVALPAAVWITISVDDVGRQEPSPDCVVIVDMAEAPAAATLSAVRAAGFAGAAIVITESTAARQAAEASRLGAAVLMLGEAGALSNLPRVMLAQRAPALSPALRAQLTRSWRLVAAGEIAMQVRHDLNNHLAALLAEAQLLELEELPPEASDGVRRIVALCRRTIAETRRLEVAGEPDERETATSTATSTGTSTTTSEAMTKATSGHS